MKNEEPSGAFIFVVIICLIGIFVAVCLGMFIGGQESGYKSGQIDAANGKQYYHLTTRPDGEQKWMPTGH